MTENFKAPMKTRAALYGFLILAIFAPFIVGAAGGNYWVRVLDFALLYIMLALGLNIVVGFAGLLDLGYIAFYAVGAYVYALLASPHFDLHLPFWMLLPLGGLTAALFGVLLGHWLLQEALQPAFVAGSALVLLGIGLVSLPARRT